MEKSLYQAPVGLGSLVGPEIEVIIEEPELTIEVEEDFNSNLADELSSSQLQSLASELIEDYGTDISS